MVVSLSESVTLVSAVQLEKALSPIVVTLFGSVTLVKLQPRKADAPIVWRPSGSVTPVSAVQPKKTLSLIVFTPLGIVMPVSALQLTKAKAPIVVTLEGRVTAVSAVQPKKAFFPTEVTPAPIVTVSICSRKAPQGWFMKMAKSGMSPDPVMERVLVPGMYSQLRDEPGMGWLCAATLCGRMAPASPATRSSKARSSLE